jgi:hypothetical protein
MWDGMGLSGVGLPSESVMVVRVIGKGDGFDDGDKDAIRDERVSLVSWSEGKAASTSGWRSLGVLDDSEACRAYALSSQQAS